MPLQLYNYTHSKMSSSQQRLGSISHSRNLPFLDKPCYYDTDNSPSQITASTSRGWRQESESLTSMSQCENAPEDSQQFLVQYFKSYSLHILVAIIVTLFLFEIAVRLPFLLALTFAIPYVHMMLTPEKPTLHNNTHPRRTCLPVQSSKNVHPRRRRHISRINVLLAIDMVSKRDRLRRPTQKSTLTYHVPRVGISTQTYIS
ncbi:hypothetical protein BKA58DRAFT_27158 [Alternaria rosae]|uniref:uncharacterized protein n=1 Tax=Alternaria rosae TaxID=1187941 RepID=UPI001E8E1BE2|nr:uncharacterized protein BKA58DRAFT_27158 [Alternaria rosae]KAH6882935.1 hypothetical protein BKA58DRAFT_27158 [Alternaria rosae]